MMNTGIAEWIPLLWLAVTIAALLGGVAGFTYSIFFM